MPTYTSIVIATCVASLTFYQAKDVAQAEHDSWLNDKPRASKLRRKMDLRILPLCAWMYVNEGDNPTSWSRFRLNIWLSGRTSNTDSEARLQAHVMSETLY